MHIIKNYMMIYKVKYQYFILAGHSPFLQGSYCSVIIRYGRWQLGVLSKAVKSLCYRQMLYITSWFEVIMSSHVYLKESEAK